MSEPGPDVTYPRPVMANLLLMTERHVNNLARDGVLVQRARNEFELFGSVQGYVRYLRERSVGGDSKGNSDLAAVKGRLISARTRMAEAEAGQIEGLLLSRTTVEQAWAAIAGNLRTRLLALPSRVAPQLYGALTQAEILATLTDAIAAALTELAATPIYAAPDADRIPSADPSSDADDEAAWAATEANDLAMG